MQNGVNCWKAKSVLSIDMLISNQAAGSANCTAEGSQTRGLRSATNNDPHECPVPLNGGKDIVGHSKETWRDRIKSLSLTERTLRSMRSNRERLQCVSTVANRMNWVKPYQVMLRAIPSQAAGSANCTAEGLETRVLTSAMNNRLHERPGRSTELLCDIVQSSEKSERRDKEPYMGKIAPFVPMVRAIFPNLAAHNLASVQPMLGPVSLVFFMKFLYGSTKGAATAGDDIITNPNSTYASENIDAEQTGTGDGATANPACVLSYTPIKAGTVVMTTVGGAVALEVTDDGAGNLTGDCVAGAVIDYTTGIATLTWTTAPDLSEPINAAYSYDMEGNDTVPDIDMQLTSAPVTAVTRKLRTRWSLEAAQDLRNLHGLEAEIEQVAAISNELKFEIDREIINGMAAIAGSTVTAFSKTPVGSISFTEHKLAFVDKLIEASNSIFNLTQRATGTWVVCGINVASLLESLPGFVPSPRPKGTRAIYKSGVLNGQWDIWKDPNYTTNGFMMGYQGDSMWEVNNKPAPRLSN